MFIFRKRYRSQNSSCVCYYFIHKEINTTNNDKRFSE